MGIIIKPGKIRTQVSTMVEALQDDSRNLHKLMAEMESFEGNGELTGVSWSSMKRQVSSHKVIAQGIICGHDRMLTDNERLSALVGDEDLVEEELRDHLAMVTKRIADFTSQRESYLNSIRFLESSLSPGIAAAFTNYANRQVNILEHCISESYESKAGIERKIEKMYEIVAATNGLNNDGGLYKNSNLGLAAISGNFEGKVFKGSGKGGWKDEITAAWEKDRKDRTRRFLLREGVTKEQLENMYDIGYRVEEIYNSWISLETKEDYEFFGHLMNASLSNYNESYGLAFGIDPMKLSDKMDSVLANYAFHIFLDERGNITKRFTDFNNSLFMAQKPCTVEDSGGKEIETGPLLYRDVYLKKMYFGSGLMVVSEAAVLGMVDPKSEGYQAKFERYCDKVAFSNLWDLEMAAYLTLKDTKYNKYFPVSISDLGRLKGSSVDIKFKILHETGETSVDTVESSFKWLPGQTVRAMRLDKMEKLRLERDTVIIKTAAKGLYSIAKIFVPGDEMVEALFDTGKTISTILSTAKIVGESSYGGYTEYDKKTKEMADLGEEAKKAWIGTSLSYTINGKGDLIHKDGLNPKILYYLNDWQKNGLSWTWDDEMKEKVVEEGVFKVGSDEYKIIYGGYDLAGEINGADFDGKIESIEEKYQIINKENAMDIQGAWYNLLNGIPLKEGNL